MPPKTKARARAFKPTQSEKAATSAALSASIAAQPPAPFKHAPSDLEPLLKHLSKDRVYILHIDTKPRDFKRKIFLVPVLMNLAILGLLAWRIQVIHNFYLNICFALMGRPNEMTIDTKSTPMNELLKELGRRFAVFFVDLLLYVFIWPWPRDFFAGRKFGNPVAWRFGIGFRDKEIIVRRSRKWLIGIGDVLHESTGQAKLFEVVKRATDPIWMSEKTGYLMLNNEWDLDWRLMMIAAKGVDKDKLKLEAFKTTVLLYHAELGWLTIETGAAGGSAKEEEGRRKIVAFKDELTALGKENLFFRWIELVQFESSQPGGFGPEQQAKTMVKAKEMFEAQGVDFDQFWAKIGGMEGMPGMDL